MVKKGLNLNIHQLLTCSIVTVTAMTVLPFHNTVTHFLSNHLTSTMILFALIGLFALIYRANQLILFSGLSLIALCMHVQGAFNTSLALTKHASPPLHVAQFSITEQNAVNDIFQELDSLTPHFSVFNIDKEVTPKAIIKHLGKRYKFVRQSLSGNQTLVVASNTNINHFSLFEENNTSFIAGQIYLDSLKKAVHFMAFNTDQEYLLEGHEQAPFKQLNQYIEHNCKGQALIVFNTSSILAWAPALNEFKTQANLSESALNTASSSWDKRIYFNNELKCISFNNAKQIDGWINASYQFIDSIQIMKPTVLTLNSKILLTEQ